MNIYRETVLHVIIKLAVNVIFYFRFVDEVIRGLISLHETIQPLTMFNFGGDEVPLAAWLASPQCLELLEDDDVPEGSEREYIKGYFVRVRRLSTSM